MNPAEIDALIASVQAAKATGQPVAPEPLPDPEPPPSPAQGGAEIPLGMLFDLSLPVSIELGRTTMTVQEVLRLGRGSVIQLDRLAGEPIDIYVGERKFAEGEVVVLGEHFGVRIVRIFAGGGQVAGASALAA